jgi:hypothetical protein
MVILAQWFALILFVENQVLFVILEIVEKSNVVFFIKNAKKYLGVNLKELYIKILIQKILNSVIFKMKFKICFQV